MAKTTPKGKKIDESVFTGPDILPTKMGNAFFTPKKLVISGIILTTCVILGIGLFYYFQYQHAQMLLKNPVLASEAEQEALVARIGKLTMLPIGELPTIAKVTDSTKLQGQEFFKDARNGDIVLIYTKAKRIVLYDPAANKVIQADTFATQVTGVQGASTAASPMPVSIAIYNGTTIAGLAKKTEATITQTMKQMTVVAQANATKQNYTQTLVVDLTGKQSAAATQLASVLNGIVGPLPAGEIKPAGADILVILGEQK